MYNYLKTVYGLYVPQAEVDAEELEGQGMVEYGLILALVSIVAIATLVFVGEDLEGIFQEISDELGGAGS